MGTRRQPVVRVSRFYATEGARPVVTRPWMQLEQRDPAEPVTAADVWALADIVAVQDVDAVKALALRAVRAGQRPLSLELYRAVELRNRVRQVQVGSLRHIAGRLAAGDLD